MIQRWALVSLAGLVLLLAGSFVLRQHLGARRCAELGLVYREGRGCVPDPGSILLQRELQRS